MSEPGHQVAAGEESLSRLRAGRGDREHVIGVLQTAFVQGRLTKDELDTRLSQALTARTYADLAAITADIPAWLTPVRQPARAFTPTTEAVTWSTGATFLAVTLMISRFLAPGYFLLVAGFVFAVVFGAGAQFLYARHEQRSRGHRPVGPGSQPRTAP